MAGEETTNQGNIKQNVNAASTGLNLDQSVNQISKGKLTYALNAALENFDANSVSYQNEQGNEFCLSFPEGYQLIGEHFIAEKNKHIFFLANPIIEGSEIGYMDNNDCIYHTLINASCLNFNINHPIPKTVHKITNCSTEIYWTDGHNPRRWLDLENIPYKLASGSIDCDAIYTNELDCNQLNIQPNFNIPKISVVDVNVGGELQAGTYQFSIQYCAPNGDGYTSYYSVTNPTPIADPYTTTNEFNYTVGKSIDVEISNLDTTGNFQYFNLAVIKTVNGVSSVELIGTYYIDNATKHITYTGQNVTQIKLTVYDIFEKFPYYEVAQDLTAVRDILVWDNLTSIDRINYQKIANQISLQWETYRIPATENYADELNATNLRGYLRDEVYAFEIVFLLKNGKQTDGFHIPGRIATPNDIVDVLDTNNDFIGEPDQIDGSGVGHSPYWKIYNTATVSGTSPAYSTDPGYKGPYQYGAFSYWESTELYPCNTDVWGELSNTPIRHHKFPDVAVSPIYESKLFTNSSDMVMGNDAVFPIGVKLDVSQVSGFIASSTLTQEQKDAIVGFKIVRGDRSTNKSIVAKGILRNVGKYTKEDQEFYYPNYPYNDLNADPFLNKNNNAWVQLCKSYNITIAKLQLDPLGGPSFAEVRYTSCENNKETIQKYYNLGQFTLCSIVMPKIMVPEGGIVRESTYEIWHVRIIHKVMPFFPYDPLCHGFRVTWTNPSGEIQTEWVEGAPTYSEYNLEVMVGTEPYCSSNCDYSDLVDNYCIIDIKYVKTINPDVDCKIEQPLPSITSEENIGYRQIFNSPETSFGQPFLGNVLKLESVMFGAGKAHFVEVKNNAKYKLLTAEAQQDALNSARDLGAISDPFGVSAMFSAYQSYIEIYINGITRKNYAYSYNSIADYNYGVSVPDGLGEKQRQIDLARYLFPGVQSVGEQDVVINNYQRESSVYIRTDLDRPSLPFPSNSHNMMLSGTSMLTDKSRFTISGIGSCATPSKEQPVQVVSYYASIKNIFINQWGQMYSYNTIDTGFQSLLNDGNTSVTIFGGDTFINRFAFKTKLPFFFDNRVNAPDDSDIFYDEVGNIAYPKYWHSARSILKDYTVTGTGATLPPNMSNIISYKAHNFDCPNSQEPGPDSTPPVKAESNPNRTFYDGYFYLFAYGVPNFYCESSYNVDLRQAFNNREGDFWPHVSTSIPDDWVQESFVSIAQDNTYHYNTTYSKQNRENTFTHLPLDWSSDLCFTYFPFRAIYSEEQNIDPQNKTNNWLTYKAISRFDFPQNYGKLTSLDGIQNKAVLARFENKSLLYNTMLTVNTSNPQAAYLGNDTLFKSSPPIDFAETDLGYVGSQHKMLLKIPQGQITVDAKRGQVFLISGNSATDLSAFGSGMNRFFTDHLAFEILRYFPEINVDNHFNGLGLHGVYDSKFDRVIITKLDYIPKSKNVKYDASLNEFYIEKTFNTESPVTERVVVYLTDTEYFCNKSWTLSYNVNTQSWVSFHSYIPNWYIAENNFFYSGQNDCCDTFAAVVAEVLPQPATTTTTSTSTTTTTSTSTTSTTTTAYTGCDIEGVASEIYCQLAGTALVLDITTTTTSTSSTTTTSTSTTTTTSTSTTTTTTTTPPTSINVYAKDAGVGANSAPIIEYTINGGSPITASTVTGASCTSYFSITGITAGDNVVFTTQQTYSMDGDVGAYSCPVSGGVASYAHIVTSGINSVSLYINRDEFA